MRVLVVVLLFGIGGCGGGDNSPDDAVVPSSPEKAENAATGAAKAKSIDNLSHAEQPGLLQELTDEPTDVPSDQSGDDAVAALKKLGALIRQDDQGEVFEVNTIASTKVTDAGLVHLKGMTNLQWVNLWQTQVTDAGLMRLKDVTNLQQLWLQDTMVTRAGIAKLQQVLPNCRIAEY